jgi:hypothetical protein
MYRFADALAEDPRLRSLDCEDLFSRPGETITAAFGHLGIDVTDTEVDGIVTSDLFGHHAKNPDRPYDTAIREAELGQLRRHLSSELAAGLAWADKILARRGLELPLPNPLLV